MIVAARCMDAALHGRVHTMHIFASYLCAASFCLVVCPFRCDSWSDSCASQGRARRRLVRSFVQDSHSGAEATRAHGAVAGSRGFSHVGVLDDPILHHCAWEREPRALVASGHSSTGVFRRGSGPLRAIPAPLKPVCGDVRSGLAACAGRPRRRRAHQTARDRRRELGDANVLGIQRHRQRRKWRAQVTGGHSLMDGRSPRLGGENHEIRTARDGMEHAAP